MRRPMLPLTFSAAILDTHTRLTRLETNTSPRNAAICTADDVDLVHPTVLGRHHDVDKFKPLVHKNGESFSTQRPAKNRKGEMSRASH